MGLFFLAQSLSSSFRVADVATMNSILQDSPVAVNVRGIVAERDITVLVDLRAGWLDWGFSFLEAHQLQLYGRHRYNVEWFHFTDESQKLQRMANNTQACIMVSNPKGLEELRQAHAPNCKTWIINDEYCKFHGDIRHYYNDNSANELFVPLGPRHDFDKAYRERPDKSLVSISERPYRFNAIFSKSTSPSRKILKTMLLENPKYTTLSQHYFIQIPWRWQRKMGSLHVNSTRYVDILGQSQFTLSPTGHNPECFRFWESILMGSIPVLVLDEEYQTHQCPNALYPVWESILREAKVPTEGAQTPFEHLSVLQEHAPFIILQNWTELEATLDRIYQEGTEALNIRQKRLIQWYERFMQERVWKVEDYLFRIP
jgi:hypothetical protein